MPLRILCLGDIVGRPGRQIVQQKLPALVREKSVDLVIANAENIAGGSGINTNLFNKIRSYGVDGRCSVIFGTHTHVPTADARLLAGGSAVISDVGMCGPYDSVLGRRKDKVLKYMTAQMPVPFEVATGDMRMCGALAEIEAETGRALSIERIEVCGGNSDAAYDADDARGKQSDE